MASIRDLLRRLIGSGDAEVGALLPRFARNLTISISGSGAVAAIGLLQTVVLTKNLPVADYGKIIIVVSFFRFLLLFLDIRIHDVIYRFLPEFREKSEIAAARSLLLAGIGVCAVFGGLVGGGVFLLSDWIARVFYDAPELASMFQIYAVAAALSTFGGFFTPILRLEDRYSHIVIPQTVGAGITLGLITVYLLVVGGVDLAVIIFSFAVGTTFQALIPFGLALRAVGPLLRHKEATGFLAALRRHRSPLWHTAFQTNVAGYLKLGSGPGGLFLLGILASPTQVALYGLARQLAQPLRMLQSNVQNAIIPEVFDLNARQRFESLRTLVLRFTAAKLVIGALVFVLAIPVARPVVLLISTPEYVEALPVFFALLATVFLTFATLIFYPLAVAMDRMGRRNLFVAGHFVYIGIAAVVGLDAFRLAIAQLAGSVTTRAGADLPLYRELSGLARARRSTAAT
jgi:O-antigen/teichoic acid export membrane protein